MDRDRQPPTRRSPPVVARWQIEILSTDGAWVQLWQRFPDRRTAHAERARFVERGHAPKRIRIVEADR